MSELGKRQRRVLRAVVQEYIRTAQPVASVAVARRYRLRVSSATVRNDLAFLEEEGLLTHPHTSAGRVPTDHGYRYFTEWLMGEADLDRDEQMTVRHQFHQVQLDTEQWSRLAASVLARLSTSASLVTMPQAERSRLRLLELVPIQGTRALLVVVLDGGVVRQQLLQLDEAEVPANPHAFSAALSNALAGKDAREIRAAVLLHRGAADVAQAVARVLEEQDRAVARDVYYDGFLNLLQQPEFASSATLRDILSLLEDRTLLAELLPERLQPGQVRLVIGDENPLELLRHFSLVFGRYGSEHGATGFVGVVGPTRMNYARSIGAVRYVGGLMTELMSAAAN